MNDLQIELALALAKYKSFSLAEQNIYVSCSVMRKQITALEKELGFRIFIRSKQSVTLTKEGKTIIEAFKTTRDIHFQAIERAKQLAQNEKNILNIGYLQFMCDFNYTNGLLQKIKKNHSDFSTRYICCEPAQLNASLNDGSTDVIITVKSEVEESADNIYIDFNEYKRCVIFSSGHRAAKKDCLDLSLLRGEQIFMFSPAGYQGLANYRQDILDIFGVSPEDIISLPNIGSMIANIEVGLGVGAFVATPAIFGNAAIKCFIVEGRSQKTVLVWKKTNKKKLLQEFIEAIDLRRSQFEPTRVSFYNQQA